VATRTLAALALLAAASYLVALVWLAGLERGGPIHLDVTIPGGIPATFYLPGTLPPGASWPEPAGQGAGPPGVVLSHGYSSDRAGTSTLARRLAGNGYGVLAIDLRGHGENRNGFARDIEGENLNRDFVAAVDWLRTSSFVDGGRIAVMGHSMGAGAALRFAERDAGVDAAVLISGGRALLGPYRPPNALFIHASGDPEGIRSAGGRLVARLAGVAAAEPGRRYGAFETDDAVQLVSVPGNDHSTILWSAVAAGELIGWLDGSFDVVREAPLALREPRLGAVLVLVGLLPLVLLGLGWLVGSVAPERPARAAAPAGLMQLGGALAVALALVSVAPLASFLGLAVVDVLAGLLGYAGLLLVVFIWLREPALLAGLFGTPGTFARGALAALLGAAGVYALMAPLGVVFHRLTPTPERAVAALALTLLLLPFFLGLEALLRRGSNAAAALQGALGRLLVLALLIAGIQLGVVPFVVILLMGFLAAVFILGELYAAAVYASSRNPVPIALTQATWLAWLLTTTLPRT